MRRLGAITTLYAVVAAVALAAPLSASEPVAVPGTAPPEAPAPAAQPTPAPAEPAPAPAEPAPAPAPPAEPAPAPPPAEPPAAAPAPEPQLLRDEAPVETKKKTIAIAAASTGVTIRDFEFAPPAVTVNVGDTVTWTNAGPTAHSATATDGSFDTGIMEQGGSGSHVFTQAGTFSYICTPHPNMKGTVTVQAASAGGGDGQDDGSAEGTAPTDAQADQGPSLPSTGLDVGGLALLGFMTLALGAYLRRRTAPEPARPAGRIGW